MAKSRSFEKLNYAVRANKNVERKLIVEILKLVGSTDYFRIRDYQYIGFGSISFADFSLLHRAIGMTDMTSIEKETTRERRLNFNKPFDCIKLILREYSDAITDLNWEKRSFVWLDYDDPLSPAMFSDLKRTLLKVSSGSLVFISANADSYQLDSRNGDKDPSTPADVLRLVAGQANLPADSDKRLGRAKFPGLVGDIFANAFMNAIFEGRPEVRVIPLMNLTYSDNVPMVTYGGIIVGEVDRIAFETIPGRDKFSELAGPVQFELSVPNLTAKEKMKFDQLLPPRNVVPSVAQLGFELKEKEIESYIKFYLQYPVFGEYQF